MSRVVAALAFLLTAVFLPAPAFAAGDAPSAREPRVHEVLTRAPSAVVIAFNWELDSGTARMYVLDSDGKNITSAAPDVSGSNMTVRLGFDLDPGTYSVYYRTNDRSGGLIGGAYQFAIGKGSWSKLETPTSWAGSDEQPKMFAGDNPNQPASDDDPTPSATQSPGLEIVREDGTVEHPADIEKAKDGAAGGSWLPWFIGGGLAIATAFAAVVLAKRRAAGPSDEDAPSVDEPPDEEPPTNH